MDRDRRLALALLAAGALVFGAATVWLPRPVKLEEWDGAPRAAVARGPAVASYDAANDTTYALFLCGHGRCPAALRVEGDARASLGGERTYLAVTHRAEGAAPMPAPIALAEPPSEVTYAMAATLAPRPLWAALVATPLAVGLVAMGALVAWRGRAVVTWGRVAAGGAGAALGGFAASFPGDAIVWGYLCVALAVSLALIVMSVDAWKKARAAAAWAAIAIVAMLWWARPFFPSPPSL
ncbi:MAG TPA: hypothetical protein VM370_10650 [Candidatus Thermoplasmatota archaeon]|nr:hypothetical protein [Candidatus Thermoplasmatota archaeon]